MRVYNHKDLSIMMYPAFSFMNDNQPKIKLMSVLFIKEYNSMVKKPNCVNFILTGTSGIHVATILKLLLNSRIPLINIIYIDKETDKRHATGSSGNKKAGELNIFVDDFITTGNTVRYVFRNFKRKIQGIIVSGKVYETDFDKIEKFKPVKFIVCQEYYPKEKIK